MATQQFSDLPEGAQVVSVPQSGNSDIPQPVQSVMTDSRGANVGGTPVSGTASPAALQSNILPPAQFSDLPAGAQVVSVPKSPQHGAGGSWDNSDYLSKTEDTIHKVAAQAGDTASNLIQGIGEGALDTVHGTGELIRKTLNAVPGVDNLGNRVVPVEGQASLAKTATPDNGTQMVGYTLENAAEFMLGDEALKGMSLADKLPKIARAMDVLSKSPVLRNQIVQKMLAAGVRQGAIGTAQEFVHSGGDVVNSAETGAATGLAGGAAEGVAQGLRSLRPTTKTINGVEVPVRASVANPTMANKLAEFVANKPALQEFDALQTQPAARRVIDTVATDLRNSTLRQIADTEKAARQGTANIYHGLADQHGANAPLFKKLFGVYANAASNVDDALSNAIKDSAGDFQGTSKSLRDKLGDLYAVADKYSPQFKESQDAEKKAAAAFDSKGVRDAREAQKVLFDLANSGSSVSNGPSLYETTRKIYSRLDALDNLQGKLDSFGVTKNTPTDFLDSVTNNGELTDPGIIDGAALRKYVRALSTDGTFARAGIDQATSNKLQELGALLERSKITENTKLSRIHTPALTGGVGAGAGASVGLALELAHALGASAIPGVGTALGAGAGAGYAANRFLGYLMTNQAALDYTLRAARTLVPAATAQLARHAVVTHLFNPETGKIEPIDQNHQ